MPWRADVVTELVFLLIAQNRERRDGRDELVVAERFETGNGLRSGAERKRQRKAEIGIARLGEMQTAGSRVNDPSQVGLKMNCWPMHQIQIIVVPSGAGGWQRGLLDERIVSDVIVHACAQEPLRARRLRPVETRRCQIVAERNGDEFGTGMEVTPGIRPWAARARER